MPAVMILTQQGKVRRTAECPLHQKKSSDFRSPTKDFDGKDWWVFGCKQKGGHLFNAEPDPYAPKTREEAIKWEAKQRTGK